MITTLHDPHVAPLADVLEDVRELKTLLASNWPTMLDALADAGVPCMITGTLATADAILKDVYRGPIIEQLNYKTYMLDMIERDSEHVDFTGRRAIVPVEATGNESPSSTTDGGTLVDPQVDTEQDAIIAIRYHDGGLELRRADQAGVRQQLRRVREQARAQLEEARVVDAQEHQPAGVR
jgi:hypothetical protein